MSEESQTFEAVRIAAPKYESPAPQAVAFLDVALITAIFILLSSSFVMAPGFGIDLGGEAISIPESLPDAPLDASAVNSSVSVLNVRGNSMIIFEGKIYSPESFAKEMKTYKGEGTLLLKLDKGVDSQTFLHICQLAKAAGFSRAQLAAKPAEY